jgi:hypothetical protein
MSNEQVLPPKADWVVGDFNGMLEENLLCLSHESNVRTASGRLIELSAGMHLTAFDEDTDDSGNRDDIFASGVVEPSPDYAGCRGSVWSLRIDSNGIRHESDIVNA